MCGIAGGLRHFISPEEEACVLQNLRERGPDDSGIWRGDGIWLANTRLAIQDLSPAGHQPMRTPDGRFTLVFNGEIYNHAALRPELAAQGIVFQSDCDTETLLHAFATWGNQCLEKIIGDYAFAVWDAQAAELFIARDPMGVKPLYYYDDGRQTIFASNVKALTGLAGLDYTLAPEVFAEYLTFLYSPSEKTPFRHIRKLLPGHYMRLRGSEKTVVTPQRYFSIPLAGKYDHQASTAEWTARTDAALSQVVAQQMHADTPVGLMLSGGLDSSLIAAMARKGRPGIPLHAFTIDTHGGMKAEGFQDDARFADIVAGQSGISLHKVSGKIDFATELDAMILALGEPQADPAALHVSHIAAAAHTMGIKVLLSGTGADDIFPATDGILRCHY